MDRSTRDERVGSLAAGCTESQVPHVAIRTCIGCRQRGLVDELLRVVVERPPVRTVAIVVPDPGRRKPGRGAWIHANSKCVTLAERRRAFGRALKVPLVDASAVAGYVEALT